MINGEQSSRSSENPETSKGETIAKKKPYAKPELRGMGKLSDLAQHGLITGNEVIVLLRS